MLNKSFDPNVFHMNNNDHNPILPDGLADQFIYEFLTKINLEISLAINSWTHKERKALLDQVQRE